MRTTIDIDEDVLDAARSLARTDRVSVGRVVSTLQRRALRPDAQAASRAGFPVFDVAADSPPITPEMVAEAADES